MARLVGEGHILNRNVIVARVHYEVDVSQTYIEDRHGLVPGLLHIECVLTELPDSVRGNSPFTLVMEDGRKLNFYAVGDGDIRPTGGIY